VLSRVTTWLETNPNKRATLALAANVIVPHALNQTSPRQPGDNWEPDHILFESKGKDAGGVSTFARWLTNENLLTGLAVTEVEKATWDMVEQFFCTSALESLPTFELQRQEFREGWRSAASALWSDAGDSSESVTAFMFHAAIIARCAHGKATSESDAIRTLLFTSLCQMFTPKAKDLLVRHWSALIRALEACRSKLYELPVEPSETDALNAARETLWSLQTSLETCCSTFHDTTN
jgi:hypothetical protein